MQLFVYFAAYAASRKLHSSVLTGVLRAPMSFFDTTPIGRIINRFAKDVDSIDSSLPASFSSSFSTLAQVVITIIILLYGSWFAIFALIPLAILFAFVQVLSLAQHATSDALPSALSVSRRFLLFILACLRGIVQTTSSIGLDDTQSRVLELRRNCSRFNVDTRLQRATAIYRYLGSTPGQESIVLLR